MSGAQSQSNSPLLPTHEVWAHCLSSLVQYQEGLKTGDEHQDHISVTWENNNKLI